MNFLILINIFDRTHSTIASSFIWVAHALPVILIGPFAAAGVDLNDKRKMMLFANFFQGLSILVYAALHGQFIYMSFIVVMLYSLLDQFYIPGEASTIPNIVSKKQLAQANGYFFMTSQASGILGFVFAGLLGDFLGFTQTMFLGAIFLFLAAVLVYKLPNIPPSKFNLGKNFEDKFKIQFNIMIEGFSFIRNNKRVLYPFAFLIILQVYLAIIITTLPSIGYELIKSKTSHTGLFVILPAGVGAFIATNRVSKRLSSKTTRKKKIVEDSMLHSAILFVSAPIIVSIFGGVFSQIFLVAVFFFVGYNFVCSLIPTLTFLQTNTPKKYLGRVFGNYWFVAYSATLLPVIFSATITEILGPRAILLLIGVSAMAIYTFSKLKLEKIALNI